jgi:ABC-type multidrug transport system ATPase subunit
MTPAIETKGLLKTFGETRALNQLELTIRGGSVYGLLGPNGAGKTTAIRVLTTLLKPSGGTARVLGLDVVREAALVRQKVSLTGQYASVDEDLTGHENLVLVSRLLGMTWADARKRATELLDAFSLAEAADQQVRAWSRAPKSCSWTSRRPGSTLAAGIRSGTWCARSRPTGRPCSSPPSTSRRRTGSPSAWRSSITDE